MHRGLPGGQDIIHTLRTIHAVALLALLGTLSAGAVCAQVSGSLGLMSDYRFRGISLSDGRPSVRAGVAVDAVSGWYAGAYAATVQLGRHSGHELQLLPYLGYARRTLAYSWDAGMLYSGFTRHGDVGYPEAYLGVTLHGVTGRITYAPDYYGQDAASWYAELNVTHPLTDKVRFLGHIGAVRTFDYAQEPDASERNHLDFAAGIGRELNGLDVQLSWSGVAAGSALSPLDTAQHRHGWMLSLSHAF
jgi:uncharacterized protein (TIGR02001 family)